MSDRPAWVLPLGIFCVLFGLLAACGGTAFLLSPPTVPKFSASGGGEAAPRGVRPGDDPYPKECAAIRRWLRGRYGEVEVGRWGARSLVNSGGEDTSYLDVDFRMPGGKTASARFGVNGMGTVKSFLVND